jgi:hypothetical protein
MMPSMPSNRPPTTARHLAVAATALLSACATAPSTPSSDSRSLGDVPASTSVAFPQLRSVDAWASLHDDVRRPGLEDRRFSPEHYWELALPLVEATDRLAVSEVGRSVEGRPLREIVFGNGPIRVLAWSQMHGDESTASMALVDLLAWIGSDDPLVSELGSRITLHLIPLLNPDGAARFQRRNALGIDVNRDARRLATPEGRTLKAVHDRVQPDFAFNLHDQNVRTRVGTSDRGAAISLLAPAFNQARDVNPTRERAMRIASAIALAVEPVVGDHVTRYNDAFNARAFGDLISAWGASAVLIESGGIEGDPQKQRLRRANFVALGHALEVIASESWAAIGPAIYEDLPPNGRAVDDLLVLGGTVVVDGWPGVRELPMDLLVRYDQPLLERGGTLGDLGDLGGYEARDTLDATGLYILPQGDMRPEGGILEPGAPATFMIARDPDGRDVVLTFDGGPGG